MTFKLTWLATLLTFLLVPITLSSATLYNSSDHVVILNYENFYSTVLWKENAWIIEFYLSWCGHCKKFAPIWKEFATDIIVISLVNGISRESYESRKEFKDWQHTIKVGVIDCDVAENIPICRSYGVTLFPHIRLFNANSDKNSTGVISERREIDDLKMDIVEFILLNEESNSGSNSWVNLRRFKDPVDNIFNGAPDKAQHAVIIIENDGSIEGSYTIMDLGNYDQIYVRTMTSTNNKGLRFSKLPAIFVVERHGKIELLTEDATTREEMTGYIMNHFKLTRKEYYFNTTSELIDGDNDISTFNFDSEDIVYMVDLENAINYALTHEISLHKTVGGDALNALKDFFDILVRYFPARPRLHKFLSNISKYVNLHRDSLNIAEFNSALIRFNEGESRLPSHQPWIGCRGSQPQYRGYSCGLWTLFHTITVNAVLVDGNLPSYVPQVTVKAIHGYVKNFFGCTHCSQHFQAMYAEDAETYVQRVNDEILWLWKGHNKVNKRLKGDINEDPSHVKQLFPSESNCPSCWLKNGTFNEEEVLAYLKKIYGSPSISLTGTDDFGYSSFGTMLGNGINFKPKFGLPFYILAFAGHVAYF